MVLESTSMGIPKPRKIKESRRKVMIDLVRVETGYHAYNVCCLNLSSAEC